MTTGHHPEILDFELGASIGWDFGLSFLGRDSICSLCRKRGQRVESARDIYCPLYGLVFPCMSQYLAAVWVPVLVMAMGYQAEV